MKWRVRVEMTGEGGAVTRHVISEGERTEAGQAATLGLSLAESKATLAGLQRVLVTAQIDAHGRRRRRCGHCKGLRPLRGCTGAGGRTDTRFVRAARTILLTMMRAARTMNASFGALVMFTWDETKYVTNIAKHKVSFELASLLFDNLTVEVEDVRRDYGEIRINAFGYIAGRLFVCCYTPRSGGRHIISMRKCNAREIKTYG